MTTPDISDLLAFYANQRRVRASLSFAEKIARVEKMRERDKALRASPPGTHEAAAGLPASISPKP